MTLTLSASYVSHFRARVLADAWTQAYAECLTRRARTFETAAPGEHLHTTDRCPAPQCAGLGRGTRHVDYDGAATVEQLDALATRMLQTAIALRNRATGVDGTALVGLSEAVNDVTLTRAEAAQLEQVHHRREDTAA